jgi:hypothetical protein
MQTVADDFYKVMKNLRAAIVIFAINERMTITSPKIA